MVEAFNIIQDRISRARLAGDPPDLSLQPKLGHIGLSEFHRADEAIRIGYETTKAQIGDLQRLQTRAGLRSPQASAASIDAELHGAVAVPVVARQRSGDMDVRAAVA